MDHEGYADPIGEALRRMRRHGEPAGKGYVDFSDLEREPRHKDAPLWVCPNGDIYLEAYSPFYQKAKEFLQQCAEPKSRPQFIHKYTLTSQSIYSAVSVGLTGEHILNKLRIFSKLKIPVPVKSFVSKTAEACGTVQMALVKGRYYVESESQAALLVLLNEPKNQILEAARRVLGTGGARLTPLDLIRTKEVNYNEETEFSDKNLRELEAAINQGGGAAHGKGTGGEQLFDVELLLQAESFVKRVMSAGSQSSASTGGIPLTSSSSSSTQTGGSSGGGGSGHKGSDLPVSVTELVEMVLERFQSRQVTDVKSALQLLERALEDSEPELHAVYEDVRQRLLAVQAQDHSAGVNMYRRRVHFFEVGVHDVETLRSIALKLNYPVVEEYDFKGDRDLTKNPDLPMRLKSSVNVRPYQAAALTKVFGSNGRCRSGIVVLPCGAGKTLIGIATCANIRKRTIVFCNNNETMNQWCRSFKAFTTVDESKLKQLKLERNNDYNMIDYEVKEHESMVLFTTYAMFRNKDEARSTVMLNLINQIRSVEWGLVVFDEVHMLPAAQARLAVSSVRAHCKLGLTATLIREDHKELDLSYLIGPKLYDQNWQDLVSQGYLARVQPVSVLCPLPPKFFQQFLLEGTDRHGHREVRNHISHLNPIKYHCAEFLIDYHRNRGDKILIFFHSLRPMEVYAKGLKKQSGLTDDFPAIKGDTKPGIRHKWLSQFKAGTISVLLLSQVGDVGIDLPSANVVIEIDAQGQNKRQLAQRFGRILRPKAKSEGPQAYFYSLVSMDTQEIGNLTNRRDYLINQGFNFQVLTAERLLSSTHLPQEEGRPENDPNLVKEGLLYGTYRPSSYTTKESQLELLEIAMLATDVFREQSSRPKKKELSSDQREAQRTLGHLSGYARQRAEEEGLARAAAMRKRLAKQMKGGARKRRL
eukprot:INCI3438.1.p1 GENE.INCI3438.1~~INCI3438.1.p1  ORF type:complete len:1025 (-),score=174.55 INCI3438.1:1391-4171(-)